MTGQKILFRRSILAASFTTAALSFCASNAALAGSPKPSDDDSGGIFQYRSIQSGSAKDSNRSRASNFSLSQEKLPRSERSGADRSANNDDFADVTRRSEQISPDRTDPFFGQEGRPAYQPPTYQQIEYDRPTYVLPNDQPPTWALDPEKRPVYERPMYEKPDDSKPRYQYDHSVAPSEYKPSYEQQAYRAPNYNDRAYTAPAYDHPTYDQSAIRENRPEYLGPTYRPEEYRAPVDIPPEYIRPSD